MGWLRENDGLLKGVGRKANTLILLDSLFRKFCAIFYFS